MRILGEYGREDLAKVYVAAMRDGGRHVVEFVESLQPPIPRDRKWVLILSSSFGCPIACRMCDAGGGYAGRLEAEEITAQADYMVRRRFPDGKVPVAKFKVQFARMGEPALNPAVLDALRLLPRTFDAPGLMACVSTIAPAGTEAFFDALTGIKDELYANGRFQLQFSVHTTDEAKRDWLIPGRKWDFNRIARFGESFRADGDRKITLNFALARDLPVDPWVIANAFDPETFLVKLTPLNPTARTRENGLESAFDPDDVGPCEGLVRDFRGLGFEAFVSAGESEENRIGSNCGQYVSTLEGPTLAVRKEYETLSYRLG